MPESSSTQEEFFAAVCRGDLQRTRAMLAADPSLVKARDADGATPLHVAAIEGNPAMARLLLDHGADINAADARFHATPAGWAIEYLRELGAVLGIEIADTAHAIQTGDLRWVERFLKRFPALRDACQSSGVPLRQLARDCDSREIRALFGIE